MYYQSGCKDKRNPNTKQGNGTKTHFPSAKKSQNEDQLTLTNWEYGPNHTE